ncbi:MAG: hypothetical protein OES84_04405 [Kiritimatiellaceae bacterium]|nr:hypothetical protein [Kiritimatiellaceae bacterium]
MLRLLRITGIVVFAVLIGLSANTIHSMHQSGELFEQYNSRRKAHFTLLGSSAIGLCCLAYFELTRHKRLDRRHGYHAPNSNSYDDKTDGLDSTNIYTAPKVIDEWPGRNSRSSSSRKKRHSRSLAKDKPSGSAVVSLGVLRISCVLLPFAYAGFIAWKYTQVDAATEVVWLMRGFCVWLSVCSIITAIGIFLKKRWGMVFGYVLSISNLVVFPFGTGIGLLLLVGLLGAAPVFDQKRHSRHPHSMHKSASTLI